MVQVRALVPLVASLSVVLAVGSPDAQAKKMPAQPMATVVGAVEVVKLTAPSGFIDDVVTTDATRVAYVVAETTRAALHVYTIATQQEVVIDLTELTLQPTALELLGGRVFVVGKAGDGQVAAMFELAARGRKPAGSIAFRIAPATGITLITHGNKRRIAVHRATTTADATRHEVQLYAVENGRKVATARPFEVGEDGKNAKLEFKVNHWSAGMTRAHGIKSGVWNRKEDQRAPDYEASYDLVTGKLADKQKITDLFEQRRRFQTLAEAKAGLDFVRLAWDNMSVELWHRGVLRATELDQALPTYDPKSLQGSVAADGTAWLALKVDPVNIEAVARKKADPEYLDVFRIAADGKGVRKARVLAPKARHWFGEAGADRFWLIDRNRGFERGGKSVTLYKLQ